MKAFIVVGMAFGDEGKGATTTYLVEHSGADLVVRYNGGAQAAHNVVTQGGQQHTFSQFGSGMFSPNVKTFLSRYMLVNPLNMLKENTFLEVNGITQGLQRTFVDKRALIITPFHKALNRLKEMSRGVAKHGSCGQGIGATRKFNIAYGERSLFVGDLNTNDWTRVAHKLYDIQRMCQTLYEILGIDSCYIPGRLREAFHKEADVLKMVDSTKLIDEYKYWAKRVKIVDSLKDAYSGAPVVFEGAQGVLLDETRGYKPPHVTWTNTTCENALELIQEVDPNASISRVGVFRTYFTRHGAGPFPTEANHLKLGAPEPHNESSIYQDDFRVGHFDMGLAKYALSVCPVDSLAINHLDIELPEHLVRLSPSDTIKMTGTEHFLQTIKEHTKTPISILGFGPTSAHRSIIKS